MDSYKDSGIGQFIWDDDFRAWVLAPTRELEAYWSEWLREHPEKREVIQSAREIVLATTVREPGLPASEMEASIQNTLRQLTAVQGSPAKKYALYSWLPYAAVFLLVCSLGWWAYRRIPSSLPSAAGKIAEAAIAPGMTTRQNNSRSSLNIRLPDGSAVQLQPQSRLSYPEKFASEKREVFLTGEAFFDIVPASGRPFFVRTDELVTKVLGTSFWVRSFQKEQGIMVRVKTGKVAVFKHDEENESDPSALEGAYATVLTPNQQIVYSRKEAQMEKSLVALPEPVSGVFDTFRFEYDDVPVSRAFEDLEKAYGVDIVFEESLSDCPVTASIGGFPLYEQLRILCKAISTEYEVANGIITIKGNTCK
ncbi:MAG: hypothetical protein ABS46_03130 [Cytophagaceae bacterium SCN 52-12]|nr:MAG: hypothetical protein ABS46_03130 [Cytophagaceae bacterium SCN 52-12]